MQTENWEELQEFLAPHLARFPNNYRLGFLSAIANEEIGNTETAKNQFLDLLQANQEISIANAAKNNQIQSRLSGLKDSMPQSAVELMGMLSETPSYVYSYRKNGQPQGYYGPSAPGMYLPKDLDSCHQYAVCHLCQIANDLPAEEQEGLQKQLELAGVENANLLMSGLSQMDIQRNPMALLDIDQDNEAALAIAMVTMLNSQAELSPEICLKAYEKFKKSYPALSLFAVIKLDQTKPENQARLADIVKSLKTIEEPDLLLVSFIAQRYFRPGGPDGSDPVQNYRADFNQLLMDWYPKLSQHPQMSGWAFDVVVKSFKEEKSPARLIEFLDQELDRNKGKGKGQPSYSSIFGGYAGNQQQAISLPSYPPTGLISFPGMVYAQLEMPNEDESQFSTRFNSYGNPFDSDKKAETVPADEIALAVTTAKDPTMKVLLELKYFYQHNKENSDQKTGSKPAAALPASIKAAFGDQVTNAKSAIDQLFDASKTNVDAWYLASALAVHEKRWDDAAANLETMRSLPMTAATRRKIDGHLVALATVGLIGDLKNEKHAKVLRSAKSAALRMRRGTLSQDQRVALVSVFETLELNDEAEKMESRIARAANSGASSGGGLARAVTSVDRIKKLSEAGKTEAAARLLSQEFQGLARQELSINSINNMRYELREFKQKVEELNLEKALFKQLDPGDAANARKLGVWAIANEIFEKPEAAQGIYEKLLATYPKEDAARLRYVLLKAADNEQTFAAQFPKVNKRSRDQFLSGLVTRMSEGSFTAKSLLPLTESLIDYKEGENGDSIDDAYFYNLLSIVGSNMSVKSNDYSLPSLYEKNNKDQSKSNKSKQTKEIAALAKQQRELHDRIALMMTDSKAPGQAVLGFTALLASTEATGKPIDDSIVALALKTVYPAKSPRRSANAYPNSSSLMVNSMNFGWRSGSETNQVIKRTPVEFLSRHYGLSGDAHDQQIETIAKKLESLKAKEDAAELRQTYALCRATKDEYAPIAKGLIDSVKGNSRRPDQQKWLEALTTVIEVWKERQLQSDISPFVIAYAARKSDGRFGGSRNGVPYRNSDEILNIYVRELAKEKDLPKIEAFMAQLRLKLLGDEKQQQEIAKLVADPTTIQKNWQKVVPAGVYYNLAKTLQTRETFWFGIKESQRFPFPNQHNGNFSQQLMELMSGFKPEESEALVEWLGQSKVLNDISNFDPYYPAGEDAKTSAWGDVLRRMRYRSRRKTKAALAKRLSKKADLTFGEQLLVRFAKGKPANVYQMLGADLDTFSALPAKQQIRMAKFAGEVNDIVISELGLKRALRLASSEDSKTAKEMCLRLTSDSIKSEVSKLMKARRFQDLGVSAYEFDDWCENVLTSMNVKKSQELLAAVSKISELSSDKAFANRSYYEGELTKARFLEGVISKNITTDSMKLALAALEDDGMMDVKFSETLSSAMGEFVSSQFDRNKAKLISQNKKTPSPKAAVGAMNELVNQFGDEYGDRDLKVFIPELQLACKPIVKADAKAVDKWLHGNEPSKYPAIKNTFRLAFECSGGAFMQSRRKKKGISPKQRSDESTPYLQEILDFVVDDSLPLQARSRVAAHLVQFDGLSAGGVTACCRIVEQAFDAGQPLEPNTSLQIFDALALSNGAPDIKEAKATFAQNWARALIKRKRNFFGNNVSRGLEMLTESGDKALAKQVLAPLDLRNCQGVTVTSIELGYFPEAKKQCEKLWSINTFLKTGLVTSARYTSKLESQLPAFLDRFKDDGTKYLAELYIASLENVKAEKIKSTPESRLTALADRFSGLKFKSKRERQLSLILLSRANAKVTALPLAEEINETSIESIFTDANSDFQAKLFGAYFASQIQLGNFEPVQTQWKKVNELIEKEYPTNIPWEAQTSLDDLRYLTFRSFYNVLHDRTPEQIAELLPVLRDLNQPSYSTPLNPDTTRLAHLMAGRLDELAKFLNEHDAKKKSSKSKVPDMRGFISVLNIQFEQIKPTNPEARKNFLSNAWRFAKMQGYSFGPKGFMNGSLDPRRKGVKYGIQSMAALKILTTEELLEVGPSLAEIVPANGQVWLQLGRIQAQAGQNLEAAESFKKSIEKATKDMKKAKFNRRVEYANTLVKLKRNDEAKKLIDGIPVKQLFKNNKPMFKQLEKVLNKE